MTPHNHDPARRSAALRDSLLCVSAGRRLAVAAGAICALWLTVLWAMR